MVTLLYSGNIGIGQDLDTLLRAVAQLNEDGDLRVRIVGSGKALPRFKKLALELNLKNIEFLPPVPLYKLAELLVTGDIHVICQKPGTQGLLVPSKIYSTLAAERPSLFIGPVDCEVGRILIDSKSGFVIEPGDINRAKEVLMQLIKSNNLRQCMGKRAKQYYEHHFGRDRSVSRIIDILKTTCVFNCLCENRQHDKITDVNDHNTSMRLTSQLSIWHLIKDRIRAMFIIR